ncbi:LysE family transporter [Methylobacterium sp. ID0610]|uniref:LysE family transporter n=1 Tax=Methylobacterium carpenticola TaxID=3344827 RepID=UPI003675FCD8
MSDASTLPSLLGSLATSYALVLAVPGPNLLVVLRASVVAPGRDTVLAALGVACGAAVATALAAGCASLLPSGPLGRLLGSVVFAVLLARAALRMLMGTAGAPVDPTRLAPSRGGATFALGLVAAASNPVTIPFFAGFFTAEAHGLMPNAAPLACLLVFAMAATWFGFVGFVLSRPPLRRLVAAGGRWMRLGIAGALLGMAVLALWRVAN